MQELVQQSIIPLTVQKLKGWETKTQLDADINASICNIAEIMNYDIVSTDFSRVSYRYKTHHRRKRWNYIVIKGRTKRKFLSRLHRFEYRAWKKRYGAKFPSIGSETTPVYVPKRIMDEYHFVCDLFCIPSEEIPELRIYPKVNNKKGWYYPKEYYMSRPIIRIGALHGIRMTTVIHELIHALGYDHETDINGYSNYGHWHEHDQYSKLVCKDIYGVKEVIIQ